MYVGVSRETPRNIPQLAEPRRVRDDALRKANARRRYFPASASLL